MSNGFCVQPMSRAQILEKVKELKKPLNMKNTVFFNVAAAIEILSTLGFFEFDILEDHEMQGNYAYYDPRNNSLNIGESVYASAYSGDGRHRFTLAHELAHWYLHRNVAVLARSIPGETPKFCDSEWQANTFASMLLMDPALIKDMTVEQIVERCNVSYQAATIAKSKKLN